jgi:hypothetical protein
MEVIYQIRRLSYERRCRSFLMKRVFLTCVAASFGTGRVMSHAMAVFSDVDRKTRLFEWAGR